MATVKPTPYPRTNRQQSMSLWLTPYTVGFFLLFVFVVVSLIT